MATTSQQPRVPAWKRLGLKLKYAKDTAEQPAQSDHIKPNVAENPPVLQVKHTNPINHDRPEKKRKTSESSPSDSHSIEHSTGAKASVETETPSQDDEPTNTDNPKTIKRRKSVTFTGETKQNDGNTTQSFPDPSLDQATATFSAEVATSEPTPLTEKKSKKAKKSTQDKLDTNEEATESPKQKKTDKQTSTTKAEPTAKPGLVQYLRQFHTDKSNWKFNKNKQNDLLKHLFDVRVLPAHLNPAIIDYIAGLQGAGPRERLKESATSILRSFAEKDGCIEEIDSMNTETARRQAYRDAMRREFAKFEAAGSPRSEYDVEALAEMKEEEARGKRAEEVLSKLAEQAETRAQGAPSSQSQTNESAHQSSKTSGRKRKKRTDISSDSSSSSDSDSDSDPDTSSTPTTVSETRKLAPAPSISNPSAPKPPQPTSIAFQHDSLNMAYRPQNPSQLFNATAKPTKKFFDDDLLDAAFPKAKTYNEVATKRKRQKGDVRGFAYTHGTRADESGSEEDD